MVPHVACLIALSEWLVATVDMTGFAIRRNTPASDCRGLCDEGDAQGQSRIKAGCARDRCEHNWLSRSYTA
jgi:hypothetical protein